MSTPVPSTAVLSEPGLPGIAPDLQVTDKVAIDVDGFSGEAMGGIYCRGVFRTPVNAQGQTVYYCVCPNNLETDQDSRGDLVFTRLPFASLANAAQDTIYYEWWMRDTKTGRGRLFEAVSYTAANPARKIVTGAWLDSTTPITYFRERVIKADGTNTGISVNWFVKTIPSITGLTVSQHGWVALGLL